MEKERVKDFAKMRWENYFLRSGDDFVKFWGEYLGDKEHNILFIIGLGFDPRMCTAVNVILDSGGEGKRDCLLVTFNEGEDSPSRRYNNQILLNRTKLENQFSGKGKIIEKQIKMFSDSGSRVGSRSAAAIFSDANELDGYTDVVVDINAIPRALYFPIIGKLLSLYDSNKEKVKKFNIHIIVTENPTLDAIIQPEGLDDRAEYIHGFGGGIEREATAEIPRVWIPILGERRASHMGKIHTLVSPKEICPVLPFPATNPRKGDNLILEYHDVLFGGLHVEPTNIIYAAEQNPFEFYRKITRTVIQYDIALKPLGGCKIILSALSSKLLSVGAILAAYDLKSKGYTIGVAHVESQGYKLPEEKEIEVVKDKAEFFLLWLAGELYDGE